MTEVYSRYEDAGRTEHPDHAKTLIRNLLTAVQTDPTLRDRALTIAERVAKEITSQNVPAQRPRTLQP